GKKHLSAWQPLAADAPEESSKGDPARGARLYTEHACAGCHAPGVWVGPGLSHAGGIHRPGYLRRALREPAAHVVPGYAAIMPALPLDPQALEDLVAYLATLK
ncbi:MAG TPA: cytochrome c, partial [Thiobacillaceae bacterium]|nr:cytochrome c [Thiobacillaceae bacterium]